MTTGGGNATFTAASLALIALLTLLALLIQKEIASGVEDTRARSISRALNVAIVPLIMAILITIVVKVIDSLR
jgi:hypothetical protein